MTRYFALSMTFLLAWSSLARAQQVYFNDFQAPVGSEWSNSSRTTTPTGRTFLGDFVNTSVVLTLNNLPVHSNITISFDLFVLESWDGNGGGPDRWMLSAVGNNVFTTTFAHAPGQTQAYPGNYPGSSNPPYTGAIEVNTLGGGIRWLQGNGVYHIDKTTPHSQGSMQITFSATGLQQVINGNGDWDESWGLDNVQVMVDDGWIFNSSTGSYYHLSDQWNCWHEAEDYSVALGGHLVAINTAEENQWVLDTLEAHFPGSAYLMIGLYQQAGGAEPGGGWVWSNGDPFTFQNWRSGEPNDNGGVEDYGTFYGQGACCPGKWNDVAECGGGVIAMVERAGPPPDEQPQPGVYIPTEPANLERLWQWEDSLGRFVDPGGSILIEQEWPTYIIAHGWNGKLYGATCGGSTQYARASIACAIRQRVPQSNILAWEWSESADPNENSCDVQDFFLALADWWQCVVEHPSNPIYCSFQALRAGGAAGLAARDAWNAAKNAKSEGQQLGDKLNDLLGDSSLGSELHFIGSSHGGGLLAYAAREMSAAHPVDTLTVLDTPEVPFANTLQLVKPEGTPLTKTAVFHYPLFCGVGGDISTGGTNVVLDPDNAGSCGSETICHVVMNGCDPPCSPSTPVGWYPEGVLADPSFDSANVGSILNVAQFPPGYFEESSSYTFVSRNVGACCLGSSCSITTESTCLGNSGQFLGINSNCSGCSTLRGGSLFSPDEVELALMAALISDDFSSASTWVGTNAAIVTNLDPMNSTNAVVLMSENGDASFFKTIDWPAPVLLMTFDYMFREPRGGEALTVYVNDEIVYYDAAESSLATGALTGSGSVYVGSVAGTTANIAFVLTSDGTAGGSAVIDNLKVWAVAGDFDLDGRPDFDDVPSFVDALLGLSATPALALVGDMDRNGATDGGDMQQFIDVVLSP